MYKNYQGIEVAYLTTAVAVDDATRSKVLDIVAKQTGKKVELIEKVDAAVIGGFILRYGDNQVDTSIAGKIHDLKKEFEKNLYVKEY
jgi:F-type H+-transporting ATPase subunit delta